MPDDPTATAARRCSSCGRVRAECRTPDQPFLSCCNDCAANDGDTHSAPKGEVCTGPCDHDKHERRGPTWFGWYEPTTTAALDVDAIADRWLRMCGACDGGLMQSCVCPDVDPRVTIQALVDEVRRLS